MLFLETEKLRFSMKRHRLMFYTLVNSCLTQAMLAHADPLRIIIIKTWGKKEGKKGQADTHLFRSQN